MEPLLLFLLLALAVMVGCAAMCFLMFTRQRDMGRELDRLKEVMQAFLSVQERNINELRTEIKSLGESPQGSPPERTPDKTDERKDIPEDSPGQDALLYAESQEKAQRRRFIWELADQGLSMEEIARRTQLPLGQVDVILNMRGVGKEGNKHPWL